MPRIENCAEIIGAQHIKSDSSNFLSEFDRGVLHTIDTLPDDMLDDRIHDKDKWAFRRVIFWNEQEDEFWIDSVSTFHRECTGESASHWSPLPLSPNDQSLFD